MEYSVFSQKLKNKVFGEDLNYEILETVLKNPQRYIGLFRVTNAKTKLIQNITQSCEIKFGDFLEEIFTEYIAEMGFENLNKKIGTDDENNDLNADQVFCKDGIVYLIEQKVRDDHDSTKKRGQYANFIKKIKCLKKMYPNAKKFVAAMWFTDDSLKKNRKYYLEQMENNTDLLLQTELCYGIDIFNKIFKRVDIWKELLSHLKRHKDERSKDILNVPDFDSSLQIRKALLKIRDDEPNLIKKLLSDKVEYIELRKELFPTGKNLEGLR
ncbi:restriction endonuclease [Pasteurellaceae bacterium Pebbles2]|nr:restriction endonuclease [Pasteurellaceae bacterium Pebbles2]